MGRVAPALSETEAEALMRQFSYVAQPAISSLELMLGGGERDRWFT